MTQSKLTDREWRSLMEFVQRIYQVNEVSKFQQVSLECLCTLLPANQYIFFIAEKGSTVDRPSNLSRPVVIGSDALFMNEFLSEKYMGSDADSFFFSGQRFLGSETETSRDSDQITEEYLTSTRIYNEMYIPQGIHYCMRSFLVKNGVFIGSIEIFNSKEQGDFSDKQLNLLETIAPYIATRLDVLLDEEDMQSNKGKIDESVWKRKYGLTARELEITNLIVAGTNDERITNTLCISHSTFKKHLYNIYKKIGVDDRAGLLLRYIASISK